MAFTTEATVTVGQVLTAAIWNLNVRDNINYLGTGKAHARIYNNANISIANATFTAVTFNQERVDVGGMHSLVTNTGRLTIPTGEGGWFEGVTHDSFAANATANRGAMVRLNGSTYVARDLRSTATAAATSDFSVPYGYQLIATDYLEPVVYQDSGGALNLLTSGNYSPEFYAMWRST